MDKLFDFMLITFEHVHPIPKIHVSVSSSSSEDELDVAIPSPLSHNDTPLVPVTVSQPTLPRSTQVSHPPHHFY